MKLENLTPDIDISKIKITQPDINRPALQLAGYFEHFEATRLQIIGFVEYSYIEGLPVARKKEIYERLLSCVSNKSNDQRLVRSGFFFKIFSYQKQNCFGKDEN